MTYRRRRWWIGSKLCFSECMEKNGRSCHYPRYVVLLRLCQPPQRLSSSERPALSEHPFHHAWRCFLLLINVSSTKIHRRDYDPTSFVFEASSIVPPFLLDFTNHSVICEYHCVIDAYLCVIFTYLCMLLRCF